MNCRDRGYRWGKDGATEIEGTFSGATETGGTFSGATEIEARFQEQQKQVARFQEQQKQGTFSERADTDMEEHSLNLYKKAVIGRKQW